MRPQLQPTATTCGQTCLAIVSGLPVSQLQRLIRKRGRTQPADIEHGLALIGKVNVQRVKLKDSMLLPAPSIIRMVGPGISHWVVYDGRHIIDPLIRGRAGLDGFVRFRLERRRCRFVLALTWDQMSSGNCVSNSFITARAAAVRVSTNFGS